MRERTGSASRLNSPGQPGGVLGGQHPVPGMGDPLGVDGMGVIENGHHSSACPCVRTDMATVALGRVFPQARTDVPMKGLSSAATGSGSLTWTWTAHEEIARNDRA